MKFLRNLSMIFIFAFGLVSYAEMSKKIEINQEKGSSYFYENFGRVMVGTAHYARYTVKNTGDSALAWKDAVVYGSIDFEGYHSCRNGLQPQQSCWIEIRYWPMFEGWDTGTFVITFDQQNRIQIDLNGEAYRL